MQTLLIILVFVSAVLIIAAVFTIISQTVRQVVARKIFADLKYDNEASSSIKINGQYIGVADLFDAVFVSDIELSDKLIDTLKAFRTAEASSSHRDNGSSSIA